MGLEGSDHQRWWRVSASCLLISSNFIDSTRGLRDKFQAADHSLAALFLSGTCSFAFTCTLLAKSGVQVQVNVQLREAPSPDGQRRFTPRLPEGGVSMRPVDTPVPPHSLGGSMMGVASAYLENGTDELRLDAERLAHIVMEMQRCF